MIRPSRTVAELLVERAVSTGDERAYLFLDDDGASSTELTYAQLDAKARGIAQALTEAGATGQRALLLFPDGLDFVAAFFGCLYAGVTAVPASPPHPARLERTAPRLNAIVKDCAARFLLTHSSWVGFRSLLTAHAPDLSALPWIVTDAIDGQAVEIDSLPSDPEQLAYLQYTSGSTGSPKGVMLSHGNLLHNQELMRRAFEPAPNPLLVGWVPLFHDFGLVGNVLQPLYCGYPSVLMSPLGFLKSPIRWLQAISKFRATLSGGPNFAFDLCVRRTTEAEREGLDLSSWRVAPNSAEPVRPDTLARFTEMFAPHGLRPDVLYPCYGLAEASLVVTGHPPRALPRVVSYAASDLEEGAANAAANSAQRNRRLVSCGTVQHDQQLRIVDPETRLALPPNRVGEIWVRGGSIAKGYWGRERETERVFGGHLANEDEGGFLRTGDLGFVDEQRELFVTGRMKDLIIVRGRNLHPEDIEASVQQASAQLRPGCGIVFPVEDRDDERLVIVQEINEGAEQKLDVILEQIVEAVVTAHQVRPLAVVLIRERTLPKTSSGKLKRHACAAQYKNDALDIVGEWRDSTHDSEHAPATASSQRPGRQEVERWLIQRLGRMLDVDPARLNASLAFATLGLDSAQAVELASDLEQWWGETVSPTLAWEYPTIESLANHLAGAQSNQAVVEPAAAPTSDPANAVAIVGIGCRFPGANGVDEFWDLLHQGKNAIRPLPPERYAMDAQWGQNAEKPDHADIVNGGFLDEVDRFDARFFGIVPREAAAMDPQQRMLLEVTHEALEDAALPHRGLNGTRTGVFVGLSSGDYAWLQLAHGERIDAFYGTGAAHSIAANRISYTLGIQGPSLTIDTACSSSLVATQMACRSLQRGECDLAIVGGANLILSPANSLALHNAGVLSPTGSCNAFDAGANGIVRGEGVGVVILKPLSQAIADGDHVYAAIRGGAVNNDGATNGLMAPNPQAQQSVLRAAYADANLDPADIDYVEAHGTGTPLGDPIEANALAAVVGSASGRKGACRIGSVKTNIGHLEAAAGMAGLIKTALSIEHGMLPPSLHYTEANPHISFETQGLAVQTQLEQWPEQQHPRRAGVSSFGFGGTNAHLILEQAPAQSTKTSADADRGASVVVPLSAANDDALYELVRRHRAALDRRAFHLHKTARACALGRTHHATRTAIRARSTSEFAARLDELLQRGIDSGTGNRLGRHKKVIFVFPGQGGQWRGMARGLMKTEAVFREAIHRIDRELSAELGWSVSDELSATDPRRSFDEVNVVQPLIFAVQYALAELLVDWGVRADAIVGHSMGEVAAAAVAGALSLRDACRVIAVRSQALAETEGTGGMLAVDLSADEVEARSAKDNWQASVAAYNGPRTTLLSGALEELQRITTQLEGEGIFCRIVEVTNAGHSREIEPALESVRERLRDIEPQPTRIPLSSTVREQSNEEPRNAAYWADNLRRPVRFWGAIEDLLQRFDEQCTFVEIGPHPILSTSLTLGLTETNREHCRVIATLRRDTDAREDMLDVIAELYGDGHDIEWKKLFPDFGERARLPTYPWQRERYWIQANRPDTNDQLGHPILSNHLRSPAFAGSIFEGELSLARQPWLGDHRVFGTALTPTALYCKLAIDAARMAWGGTESRQVDQLLLEDALAIPAHDTQHIQIVLEEPENGAAPFNIFVRRGHDKERWTRVCRGRVSASTPTTACSTCEPSEDSGARDYSAVNFYADLRERGVDYGPAFQRVTELKMTDGLAWARVAASAGEGLERDVAVLDACLQAVGAALLSRTKDKVYLPLQVEELQIPNHATGELVCHATLRPAASADVETADVAIMDAQGAWCGSVRGLMVKATTRQVLQENARGVFRDWLYDVEWRLLERPHGVRERSGNWLVLAQADANGIAMCNAIERAGGRPTLVVPGSDLSRVISDCGDARIEGVLFAWGQQVTDLNSCIELGCVGLVEALRAMLSSGTHAPQFWIVTSGSHGPTTLESSIWQAPLWGVGRVFAHEHPHMWGGLIDLDPGATPEAKAQAVRDILVRETNEDHFAQRQGRIHVARLVRAQRAGLGKATRSESDGTLIVAGGLGGIGLELASHLVDNGARRIILLGRRPPSDEVLALVRRLQGGEARVDVAQVDICDRLALADFLRGLRDRGEVIKGIYQLAMVLEDGAIENHTELEFNRVFQPKVVGTWNLHELTLGDPLERFVLFSSLAGIFGSPMQSNYAGANAFLDALARHRQALGLPALSVAWGPWGKVGRLASADLSFDQRLDSLGVGRLPAEEALEALLVLEQEQRAFSIVAPIDWSKNRHDTLAGSLFCEVDQEKRTERKHTGSWETSLRMLPEAQRQAWLVSQLQQMGASVLGLKEPADLDPERGLFELGLDSLMALQLKTELQREVRQTLPSTLVFNFPTVAQIARHLIELIFADSATRPSSSEPVNTPEGLEAILKRVEGLPE